MHAEEARELLSVVSPVHNEEEGIALFVTRLRAACAGLDVDLEVVLVDDGSTDASWSRIVDLVKSEGDLKGFRLSRNFGKEAAVMCGITNAQGDAVIVMDSDLQHPPKVVPELVAAWRSGFDVVEGVKRTRTGQSLLGQWASRLFNRLFRVGTGVDLTDATDFRLLSRPAVDALLELPERATFFRGISTWIGFPRTVVAFDVDDRASGTSKWGLRSLLRLGLNAVTAFTSAPLHLVSIAGVVFAALSAILGLQTLYRWATGEAIVGFTTVILLMLVQGSLILLGLGVIGEYLARIHDEAKRRPRFIVSERAERDL